MKKKSGYLRLCLDPDLEREAQKVRKRAVLFSIVITILIAIITLIIVFFG